MDTRILSVLKTFLLVWIYLLGVYNFSLDLLYSTLSVSLLGIVLLSVIIYFFRIPPPTKVAVDTVIGTDPIHDVSDHDSFFMKVVAHRGAGLDAPENSLIAFKMCAEKGCAGVEFDLTLTADDVPIIFHDDTLERLTGSQALIRKMTWQELCNIDISIKHPLKEKFQNTHVAKLDDTILQCLNNKQKMFIDIKENDAKIIKIIIDLYAKYPDLESKAVCTSFFPHIIYMIRQKNPKIVCSVAWRPHVFAYKSYSAITGVGLPRHQNVIRHNIAKLCDVLYTWTLPRIIYYMAGLSIVLLHKDAISGKEINDWRQKGVRVIAWTVNHPLEKQHFSRIFKITYMTDTLIGESSAHANNNARFA